MTTKAGMLQGSRAASFKVGEYVCCNRHSQNRRGRQASRHRVRQVERRQWRREARDQINDN